MTALIIRIDPARSGLENMRIDWDWLQQIETQQEPQTLVRLYQWDQPTVSIGKHQSPRSAVDEPYCDAARIPVVRRPTGGRAVLHANELTYAVVSNDPSRFPLNSIGGTYLVIARVLQSGLAKIGIETDLVRGTIESSHPGNRNSPSPCFVSASRSELTCSGRKIAGSAQRRLRNSFLQHGSIPLVADYELMGRVLGSPAEFMREKMISLSEATNQPVTFQQVAAALERSFYDLWPRETADW